MKKPLEQRFWKHVVKDNYDKCWLWDGSTNVPGVKGYGQINDGNGKMIATHRYSWILHRGVIPDGLYVCHKCDVRRCVNPDHLFLGTQVDNLKDRDFKGRSNYPAGERNAFAKLSEQDVNEIRKSSEYQRILAKQYGVSRSNIAMIQSKRSWKFLLT